MTDTNERASAGAALADTVERLTRVLTVNVRRASAVQGVRMPMLRDDGSEEWRELQAQVEAILTDLRACRVPLDEATRIIQQLAEGAAGPMPQVEFARFLKDCGRRIYAAPASDAS